MEDEQTYPIVMKDDQLYVDYGNGLLVKLEIFADAYLPTIDEEPKQ